MSDRLTVILSPALSAEEREQDALELCGGSLTEGNGRGCGDIWGYSYGYTWGGGGGGDYGDGDRASFGYRYGYVDGDGKSSAEFFPS